MEVDTGSILTILMESEMPMIRGNLWGIKSKHVMTIITKKFW